MVDSWAAVSSLEADDPNILKNTLLDPNNLNQSSAYLKITHELVCKTIGKLRKLWTLGWQSSGETQHTHLFTPERELRTDQSNDCSKSMWWASDFLLVSLMNVGGSYLQATRTNCKKLYSEDPPQHGCLATTLELSAQLQGSSTVQEFPLSTVKFWSVSSWSLPRPLFTPFYTAVEGPWESSIFLSSTPPPRLTPRGDLLFTSWVSRRNLLSELQW